MTNQTFFHTASGSGDLYMGDLQAQERKRHLWPAIPRNDLCLLCSLGTLPNLLCKDFEKHSQASTLMYSNPNARSDFSGVWLAV